jgi:hypothetical protein
MTREVLQLALEALKTWAVMQPNTTACAIRIPAIAAIKEVLAQPEQEPVAVTGGGKTYQDLEFLPNAPQLENGTLLYISPPQRQPLTEEQAKNLLRIGPVYAPDGVVTRTPLAYRKELLETALWAFKKAEAAHGIGEKT